MIAFIDDHRQAYGVEPICKVLPIAPSTHHAHAARRVDLGKLPARARSDAVLTAEIRCVFEANFHVYGVRKVWRQLAREGIVTALALLLNFGLSRTYRAVVALCGIEDAGAEELESGAAIHGPLQHFQLVDLTLHGAGCPRQVQRCLDGGTVAA